MSEENKVQSKQALITALIMGLIAFVAIQTWYLKGMQKQLEELQNQQAATQSVMQQAAVAEAASVESANTNTASAETSPPAANEKQPEQELTNAGSGQTTAKPDSQPDMTAQLQAQAQPDPQAGKSRPVPDDRLPLPNDDFFSRPYDSLDWDPYEEIARMQREMDRIFNNSYNRHYSRPGNRADNRPYYRPYNGPDARQGSRPQSRYFFHEELSVPEMDVKEDRTQYIILVNLPGADENDISLSLDGQRLTIKGNRKSQKQNTSSNGNIVFTERRSGNFKRSITLPEPVIKSGMKSKIENGVLTIVIPKNKRPA